MQKKFKEMDHGGGGVNEQILYEDFLDPNYLWKSKGSVSERKSAGANKN